MMWKAFGLYFSRNAEGWELQRSALFAEGGGAAFVVAAKTRARALVGALRAEHRAAGLLVEITLAEAGPVFFVAERETGVRAALLQHLLIVRLADGETGRLG